MPTLKWAVNAWTGFEDECLRVPTFLCDGLSVDRFEELFFMSKQQTLNIAFNNFSQPQSQIQSWQPILRKQAALQYAEQAKFVV